MYNSVFPYKNHKLFPFIEDIVTCFVKQVTMFFYPRKPIKPSHCEGGTTAAICLFIYSMKE